MRGVQLRSALVSVIAVTVLLSGAGVRAGQTAGQLEQAGYLCFPAGPASWVHCLRFEKFGNPSVPVKVFSTDGSEFLGTEQLLRFDIYNGQSCPQDELDVWDFLGDPPYFACHHFHTGHH